MITPCFTDRFKHPITVLLFENGVQPRHDGVGQHHVVVLEPADLNDRRLAERQD